MASSASGNFKPARYEPSFSWHLRGSRNDSSSAPWIFTMTLSTTSVIHSLGTGGFSRQQASVTDRNSRIHRRILPEADGIASCSGPSLPRLSLRGGLEGAESKPSAQNLADPSAYLICRQQPWHAPEAAEQGEQKITDSSVQDIGSGGRRLTFMQTADRVVLRVTHSRNSLLPSCKC